LLIVSLFGAGLFGAYYLGTQQNNGQDTQTQATPTPTSNNSTQPAALPKDAVSSSLLPTKDHKHFLVQISSAGGSYYEGYALIDVAGRVILNNLASRTDDWNQGGQAARAFYDEVNNGFVLISPKDLDPDTTSNTSPAIYRFDFVNPESGTVKTIHTSSQFQVPHYGGDVPCKDLPLRSIKGEIIYKSECLLIPSEVLIPSEDTDSDGYIHLILN